MADPHPQIIFFIYCLLVIKEAIKKTLYDICPDYNSYYYLYHILMFIECITQYIECVKRHFFLVISYLKTKSITNISPLTISLSLKVIC